VGSNPLVEAALNRAVAVLVEYLFETFIPLGKHQLGEEGEFEHLDNHGEIEDVLVHLGQDDGRDPQALVLFHKQGEGILLQDEHDLNCLARCLYQQGSLHEPEQVSIQR